MGEYDVIIVGAGICGLTAAIELADSGKKIMILEADEIPGGRVKTVRLEHDSHFNTGANWFHGGDANPFFQWAKARYDLGPLNEDEAEKSRLVIAHGEDVTQQFMKNLETLEQLYRDFRAHSDEDISLGDLAARTGSDEIARLAEYWATLWMAADDAHSVSAGDFFDDPLGIGGWQLEKGISYLVRQMFDEAVRRGVEIRLRQPILQIHRDISDVVLTSAVGDVFRAKQVIVTVSVAILKAGFINFDDGVRRALNEQLADVSMGSLFKICVPMQEKFFESYHIPDNFPICLVDDNPCFIHARTGGKPTITVFTGGQKGREMELWEIDDLRSFAHDAIARSGCFAGFREELAEDIVPTLWSHHLLHGGAYVVHKPGQKKMSLIDCGSIVFAGEGMLSDPKDSPGQMAGAWLAGRRAAALLKSR